MFLIALKMFASGSQNGGASNSPRLQFWWAVFFPHDLLLLSSLQTGGMFKDSPVPSVPWSHLEWSSSSFWVSMCMWAFQMNLLSLHPSINFPPTHTKECSRSWSTLTGNWAVRLIKIQSWDHWALRHTCQSGEGGVIKTCATLIGMASWEVVCWQNSADLDRKRKWEG